LTLIGLGGYDVFELNEKANDNVTDPEQLELNNYILGNVPVNKQWNYTSGAVYKHYSKNNVTSIIFSIIHLSFYGFLVRFALGIVLGFIFYYSGSLWLSILFHFLKELSNLIPALAAK